MLIDVKEKVKQPEITQLISYSVFPDPDQLNSVIEQYESNSELQLLGLESEQEIIAIIGFRYEEDNVIEIMHLAVRPDCRGAGFGRGLLLELVTQVKPQALIAETDEEGVDFYRSVGFEVMSLGEKYPGVERFQCTYTAADY